MIATIHVYPSRQFGRPTAEQLQQVRGCLEKIPAGLRQALAQHGLVVEVCAGESLTFGGREATRTNGMAVRAEKIYLAAAGPTLLKTCLHEAAHAADHLLGKASDSPAWRGIWHRAVDSGSIPRDDFQQRADAGEYFAEAACRLWLGCPYPDFEASGFIERLVTDNAGDRTAG